MLATQCRAPESAIRRGETPQAAETAAIWRTTANRSYSWRIVAPMAKEHSVAAGREGCARLVLACVAICLLLAVNGVLVAAMYTWVLQQGGHWVHESKIAQGLLFLGPVVLLFVEWRLFDLFAGRRSSRRAPSRRE